MSLKNLSKQQVEAISKGHYTKPFTDMVWTECLGSVGLFADPTDESIGKHLIRDGYWESWITSWFTKNIKEDDVCIDVGANQGYYTFLFSKLAPNGWVYAFEPNPVYVKSLRDSVVKGAYQNVYIFNYALMDKVGSVTLSIPGNLKGSASTVVKFDGGLNHVVSAIPLDHIYNSLERIDIVKIDAEGAEDKIMQGASDLIRRNTHAIIVLEWDARRFKDGKFATYLETNYHVAVINTEGNEIIVDDLMRYRSIEMIVLRRKVFDG